MKQIKLISEVHSILSGYHYNGSFRINSTIGKRVECIKVYIKRLKKDLDRREKSEFLNSMDRFLLSKGKDIIKQGEEALEGIKEIDYLGLIRRSMRKNEICLGRVDEGNLRKNNEIEIGDIKNLSYNLIEEDIYEYLKKIRRRGSILNEDLYIEKYTSEEMLQNSSGEYIKLLLEIPYDSLRQWLRYAQGKRNMAPDDYLENIEEALKYESKVMKWGDKNE
ncbi:MAG TPA: spore coat protein [Clostridium sp.]